MLIIISCSAPVQKQIVQEPGTENVFQLPAEVNTVNGNRLTLSIQKPDIIKKDAKLAFQLAQGIINQSYILEGTETSLDQYRVKILRVKGNNITVEILDNEHKLKPGNKGKIYIKKKTVEKRKVLLVCQSVDCNCAVLDFLALDCHCLAACH